MIKVEELLYEIDLKLNRQATLQHQSIPDEDKVIALNNAQIHFIINKLGTNNTYQLGFEAFNKRYEDLQVLIEPPEAHKLDVKLVDDKLNKWEAPLTSLSPEYMFYIDSYAVADKGKCKDIVIFVNNDLTKHKNITTLLNSSLYVPSFEYRETFSAINKFALELYTDGTFSFKEVFVSYLRYPKIIDIEGYVKLDGTDSVTQNCELPFYLKDTLVDLAIEDLAMSTGNQEAVQYTQKRLQEQE